MVPNSKADTLSAGISHQIAHSKGGRNPWPGNRGMWAMEWSLRGGHVFRESWNHRNQDRSLFIIGPIILELPRVQLHLPFLVVVPLDNWMLRPPDLPATAILIILPTVNGKM